VNVVGELQRKRTLAASRSFLATARLSCTSIAVLLVVVAVNSHKENSLFNAWQRATSTSSRGAVLLWQVVRPFVRSSLTY